MRAGVVWALCAAGLVLAGCGGRSTEGPSGSAGRRRGRTASRSPVKDPLKVEKPAPSGSREISLIAQSPRPEDLDRLRRAAADASWQNRYSAVTGIARLKEKGDPALLLRTLANSAERPEVRAAAAEGLGAMRHIDAGPALIRAMNDPSAVVRAAAGVALRKIMRVHYGYHAADPPDRRQQVLRLIRQEWPKFYAIAKENEG